jgi:uncharacterized protein GlcG (DUF336 family)
VDSSGILVAFLKMDGVRAGSPDLAIGKARASALLQRPSAETESAVNDGRPAFATSGLVTLRGGAPLMAGAAVVGAVGIASRDKDSDVKIAEAGNAVSDVPRLHRTYSGSFLTRLTWRPSLTLGIGAADETGSSASRASLGSLHFVLRMLRLPIFPVLANEVTAP